MTDEGRWQFVTRTKLIAGAVGAVIVAGGAYWGACSGAVRVIEAPDQLELHKKEAAERWEENAAQAARFWSAMERARLAICEAQGRFPSECPQFTIDHEEVP